MVLAAYGFPSAAGDVHAQAMHAVPPTHDLPLAMGSIPAQATHAVPAAFGLPSAVGGSPTKLHPPPHASLATGGFLMATGGVPIATTLLLHMVLAKCGIRSITSTPGQADSVT